MDKLASKGYLVDVRIALNSLFPLKAFAFDKFEQRILSRYLKRAADRGDTTPLDVQWEPSEGVFFVQLPWFGVHSSERTVCENCAQRLDASFHTNEVLVVPGNRPGFTCSLCGSEYIFAR